CRAQLCLIPQHSVRSSPTTRAAFVCFDALFRVRMHAAIFSSPCPGGIPRCLRRLNGPSGGGASIAYCNAGFGTFFPCADAHSSPDQKISRLPSFAGASAASGAVFDRARPRDRHRGRDGRGPISDQETIMAIIGNFARSENGYIGSIKTAAISVKVKITLAAKENDKAPDFRVFADQSEFGAAWKKTSSSGREYLSVKLDDPSFPAPVFASLIGTEQDGFVLIWSRRDVT